MPEEILDIVNDKDEVVGQATYADVHKKGFRHRIVHVFIQNKNGELLLQLRSKNKSSYPEFWTFSIGGHVSSGEDYKTAALREGKEELHLAFVKDDLIFYGKDSYIDDAGHAINYETYSLTQDGPFTINPEEVEEVKFVSLDTLRNMIRKGEKLHKEMLVVLEKYFGL